MRVAEAAPEDSSVDRVLVGVIYRPSYKKACYE
jgi:hypothetical protein